MVRISLLPLLVYFIAQNNVVKIGALLYFGLTLSNILMRLVDYLKIAQNVSSLHKYLVVDAGLITIYLMYRMWKDEGAFRDE